MASTKESLALQEEQATISQNIYFLYIVTLDGKYTRALTFERMWQSKRLQTQLEAARKDGAKFQTRCAELQKGSLNPKPQT
jgi:hypothetical protein